LILEPAYDPQRALDLLSKHRVCAFNVVPLVYETIAELPGFPAADLSSLTFATVGGAPVSPGLFEKWHRRGVTLRQLYGMTELGGAVSIMPTDEAAARPTSFGRGTMFAQLRIVDELGDDCPDGEPGQILARGPGMMAGYWRNPTATADIVTDGWIQTGDVAVRDQDGFFTYVDRMKDMIISGGFNIPSTELESAALAVPGVVEVAAIPIAHKKWGEVPALIIVTDGTTSPDAVQQHCRMVLSDYKVPKHIFEYPVPLPRNANGKILKRDLRAEYNAVEGAASA
jgi:fatty-acyl-CoA synthase